MNLPEHARLTYSTWSSPVIPPVREILGKLDDAHREGFIDGLLQVLGKINQHESVKIMTWQEGYLYVQVKDRRIKHYPCASRFLISFDVSRGTFNDSRSRFRYCFARKGWHALATRLSKDGAVYKYSSCKHPDYTRNCQVA